MTTSDADDAQRWRAFRKALATQNEQWVNAFEDAAPNIDKPTEREIDAAYDAARKAVPQ